MNIDIKQCVQLLKEKNDFLILTHAHPDGDTLGSGFALCLALRQIGKNANVINADEFPKKYGYIYENVEKQEFDGKYIVAVDVATETLLGSLQKDFGGKINLCIDHHATNTNYAENILLDGNSASCCEIVFDVINELGATITKTVADCLYTGISTDTGCFRFANTTANTFSVAAELVKYGADNAMINRKMFETKTKTYAHLERLALEGMKFYYDGKVAIITVTQQMYKETGSSEIETEASLQSPAFRPSCSP